MSDGALRWQPSKAWKAERTEKLSPLLPPQGGVPPDEGFLIAPARVADRSSDQ